MAKQSGKSQSIPTYIIYNIFKITYFKFDQPFKLRCVPFFVTFAGVNGIIKFDSLVMCTLFHEWTFMMMILLFSFTNLCNII